MDKTYDPSAIESRWYRTWEDKGWFSPTGTGDPFCIMIPPPNVTGTLHMGHAFQDTIMDTLTRYQRMRGRNTLWQPGCDHAGIATQMVVERQLQKEGLTRHDIGRDAFVDRVWDWKVRLFDEGLIYRGKRLVNWDPVLHTALSDIEVLSEEEQGSLWHFSYPLSDGSGSLTVATTRPETMLGDTAVAVHPEDERFKSLDHAGT